RPRQHLMILSILLVLAPPHHPQDRTHRPFARCQDCSCHQHFHFVPCADPVYHWRKFTQYRYHPYSQSKHLLPSLVVSLRLLILPHFSPPMCKVQLSARKRITYWSAVGTQHVLGDIGIGLEGTT